MDDVLSIERLNGGIARLTICREDAGNSASEEVISALDAFLDEADHDRSLKVVILTGRGEKFFCSGGDVKRYRAIDSREQLRSTFQRPRQLMERMETFRCPIVAAVNGWALGGGSELMLACDIRIAAPHAKIGFPYAKLGLIAGWHGTERLVRAVGDATARYLLLTGEPVDAARALALGLVHQVAGEEGLATCALRVSEVLAARAPLSPAATKRVLNAIHTESHNLARAAADAEFEDLWVSADHREAEQAFVDKRPPKFEGR